MKNKERHLRTLLMHKAPKNRVREWKTTKWCYVAHFHAETEEEKKAFRLLFKALDLEVEEGDSSSLGDIWSYATKTHVHMGNLWNPLICNMIRRSMAFSFEELKTFLSQDPILEKAIREISVPEKVGE